MFDDVLELWNHYWERFQSSWLSGDPRRDLAMEVRDRLGQLDIVLRYLKPLVERLLPEPEEAQRQLAQDHESLAKLRAGEITEEEFLAGRPPPPTSVEVQATLDVWAEVVLFTEMFYFVAWRLREVLNRSGPLQFPVLGPIEARGILLVRNHLIEHPERHSQMFQRGAGIRGGAGPALKPLSETRIDQGLFVNAQELHDQLASRLRAALSSP